MQNNLHVTVSSLVASAVVWMSCLPSKLNPVILPLMAAIKREQVNIFVFLVTILYILRNLYSQMILYHPGGSTSR
jgi:hypothetical protein